MPEVSREGDEVARPAHADRRRADGVLEHQVPADDPGDQLAERGVAVGVRAAGDRDHARELRVAEPGEARRRSPAKMNESGTAGPAYSAAASPVSTKMPAPMIAPMPSMVRLRGAERARSATVSPVASASACRAAMVLRRPESGPASRKSADATAGRSSPRVRSSDASVARIETDCGQGKAATRRTYTL